MRSFYYLAMLGGVAACGSDLELQSGVVQWMEWPAEVTAATPFPVRLVIPFPACQQWTFRPGASADQSAVTFAPYFLLKKGPLICPPVPADVSIYPLPYFSLDTVDTAPGLAAAFARTYEMRASATVYAPTPSPSNGGAPVRTFGDVTVRLSAPDTSRRNAAGIVSLFRSGACARVRPASSAPVGYVLEDQADTTGLMNAFVRGYIHDAAAPVCGETRVFHLLSRN
ncbi:MAG TPA: hypothetical protein VNJ06_02645 [Gemmatimonadales bacterium]|nr:hypothetical protein [Gemmatimonadales bacterium]